ncbi:hypothetical protein DL93DRAFT_2152445 [Clavulina sp. PMI_390]|nr:hypothetical protein DL93DRAFT_2152445 [Clavulina sp. PMI_390]
MFVPPSDVTWTSQAYAFVRHTSNLATALHQAGAAGSTTVGCSPRPEDIQGSAPGPPEDASLAWIRSLIKRAHTAVQNDEFGSALDTYELLLKERVDLPTRITILSGRAHANYKVLYSTTLTTGLAACSIYISSMDADNEPIINRSMLHARVLFNLQHFTEAIRQCNIVTSQAVNKWETNESMELMNEILTHLQYFDEGGEAFEQAAGRNTKGEAEARPSEEDGEHGHNQEPDRNWGDSSGRPESAPGSQGVAAYHRGDFAEAVAIFSKVLRSTIEHGHRISILSNRAHAYEKVFSTHILRGKVDQMAIRDKSPKIFGEALDDCNTAILLAGSKRHFKTSMLRARIFLSQELHDDAVKAFKKAASAAQGFDQQIKAMNALDQAMAARLLARKSADEKERQNAEAQKKRAAEDARVQQVLDMLSSMDSWGHGASASQIKTAYRSLAMKCKGFSNRVSSYSADPAHVLDHPDRLKGNHQIFLKVEEAYRKLSK